MGIKLSEGKLGLTNQKLVESESMPDEERVAASENARLVAIQSFVLRANGFDSDQIADFACSKAPNEVLAQVIHDSAGMIRVGLTTTQITEIANNARHESDVSYIYSLAKKSHNSGTQSDKQALESALELLRPPLTKSPAQSAAFQTHAGEKEKAIG